MIRFTFADFWNVLTLRSGYNATLVILGTTSLGIASGIVGPSPYSASVLLWPTPWGTQHCQVSLPGSSSLVFGATGPEILPLLIGGACRTSGI